MEDQFEKDLQQLWDNYAIHPSDGIWTTLGNLRRMRAAGAWKEKFILDFLVAADECNMPDNEWCLLTAGKIRLSKEYGEQV